MDNVYRFQLPSFVTFLAAPSTFSPCQVPSLCALCELYAVSLEGHLKLNVQTLPFALHPNYLGLLPVNHMQDDGQYGISNILPYVGNRMR